jgi:hypothetical protein
VLQKLGLAIRTLENKIGLYRFKACSPLLTSLLMLTAVTKKKSYSASTVPCHFVSTCYTNESLEYSVVEILYTNSSALRNKTCSGKKPPWGGSWAVTWGQ